MTGSLFGETAQTVDPAGLQSGPRWKKPLFALLLSLISDGLGQIYNGELIKGLVFALGGWIVAWFGFSYLMFSFSGLILSVVVGLTYKAYVCSRAFIVAKKFQADTTGAKVPLTWRLCAVALIIGLGLGVSSDSFMKKFFTYHAFKVPSASMCPTVCVGDRLVADTRAFRRNGPQRGNVVMFLFDSESTLHIKRVVAVGGDEVSASHGRIIVNGNPVEAPASACGTPVPKTADYEAPPELAPLRVPPGKLFLLGDDLDHSYDSRYYGTVEVSKVRARPIYLYWSPQHARIGCTVR